MCGRFVLNASPELLKAIFDLAAEPYIEPRYNIAPTQPVAIVRPQPNSAQPAWTHVQWGLIPSWSKDPSIGSQMINARSETVAEKPSFRAAFKRRRCLVPASGFYEWQKKSGGAKQPYYIYQADDTPFAIAGLWETWNSPDGAAIETCTLLTTSANELMQPLHDRMPVFVAPDDFSLWLGGNESPAYLDNLRHLFRPYPAEKMAAYPVSTFVNNARNEGNQCIAPL